MRAAVGSVTTFRPRAPLPSVKVVPCADQSPAVLTSRCRNNTAHLPALLPRSPRRARIADTCGRIAVGARAPRVCVVWSRTCVHHSPGRQPTVVGPPPIDRRPGLACCVVRRVISCARFLFAATGTDVDLAAIPLPTGLCRRQTHCPPTSSSSRARQRKRPRARREVLYTAVREGFVQDFCVSKCDQTSFWEA